MTYGDLVVVLGPDPAMRGRVGSITRLGGGQVWIEIEGADAPEPVEAGHVVLAEDFFAGDLRRRAAAEARDLLGGWPEDWVV